MYSDGNNVKKVINSLYHTEIFRVTTGATEIKMVTWKEARTNER